jgi:hypothetical protein
MSASSMAVVSSQGQRGIGAWPNVSFSQIPVWRPRRLRLCIRKRCRQYRCRRTALRKTPQGTVRVGSAQSMTSQRVGGTRGIDG